VTILLMAAAGLLVGGAYSLHRQGRPGWLSAVLLVLAALLVWASLSAETR
jgi:hypothetical protein